MKTLKQLADIGAAAAFADNERYHYMSVSEQSHSWQADEPARQAFAQAVKDAVMEDLATNQISSPTEPALIPLDIDDISPSDAFRRVGDLPQTCTLRHADEKYVSLFAARVCVNLTYQDLAAHYLRRQHGSTEWKPCTKEAQQ
jgi:hypothetical protein